MNPRWLVVLPIAAVTVPAVPAAARELPPRSTTHQNSQFWSWAGPANWLSADGAYGITITSGDGELGLDYGFSSTVCTTGASAQESVTSYYASARAALQQSLRTNWRKVSLRATQIQQLPEASAGPLYFRQSFTARGRQGRQPVAAQIQMDYSLASGPTYCYVRNISRTAPQKGFKKSMRWLGSVQASLAYFGPGVDTGD